MFKKFIKKYFLRKRLRQWEDFLIAKKKNFRDFDGLRNIRIVNNFKSKILNIEKIALTPLLKRIKKYKRYKNGKSKIKEREIYTAFGITSALYSFVNYILTLEYEKILKNMGYVSNNILAYRELKDTYGKGKNNINFAFEIFNYIKINKTCLCMVFDVKDFFGNISHSILLKNMKHIIEGSVLKDEIAYVVNNTTKFSYIDVDKNKNIKKEKGVRKVQKKETYACFRSGGDKTFRKNSRSLLKTNRIIERNNKQTGIPQGVSLSGTLSNIYMFYFDIALSKYAKENHILYRRYSDDLIFIKTIRGSIDVEEFKKNITNKVKEEIMKVELEINDSKSQNVEINSINGSIKKLNYLGFQFDGKNVYISPATISKHYSKKKKLSYKIFRYFRKHNKQKDIEYQTPSYGSLFRWVINNKGNYLNFDGYVDRAHSSMKYIGSKIKHQLKNRNLLIYKMNKDNWREFKTNEEKYKYKREKKPFINIKKEKINKANHTK